MRWMLHSVSWKARVWTRKGNAVANISREEHRRFPEVLALHPQDVLDAGDVAFVPEKPDHDAVVECAVCALEVAAISCLRLPCGFLTN